MSRDREQLDPPIGGVGRRSRRRAGANATLPPAPRRRAVGYALAVGSVLAIAATVYFARPYLAHSPLMPLTIAVLFCAYVGGLGPGLAAVALSAVVAECFFFAPRSEFFGGALGQVLRLATFILAGASISAVVASCRRIAVSLGHSEQRFRALVGQVPAVIWSTDADLRFTSGTGAALATLKLQPGQLVGISLPDFFKTDDPDFPALAAHRRAVEGKSTRFEMKWSGQTYQSFVEPLRDDGGEIVGTLGAAWDVTDRARAEVDLRQAHHELESRVAQRTADLAGANAKLEQANAELAKANAALREQAELVLGQAMGLELQSEAMRQKEAERRRAEQELRQVAARARCILWRAEVRVGQASAAWKAGDPVEDLRLEWTHHLHDETAAQQVLPLTVAMADGEGYMAAWWRARPAEDNLRMHQTAVAALLGGMKSYSQEFRSVDRHGREHWLYEDVSLEAAGGGHWRAVGICIDISALKTVQAQRDQSLTEVLREQAARAEAEAANKAKDHFLAMLSHELRTPLTPVLMACRTLENELKVGRLAPEQIRSTIQTVRRNVELEAKLIDDLLDLTRISRGKLALKLEAADAHELLKDAVGVCAEEIGAKNLQLEWDLKADRPTVRADAVRLRQVFWNLVRNAVKFTPADGALTLRSWNRAKDDGLCVEVIDTGVGIEPETLPKVFDAFEQGGGEVTRQYGGLGLGLAISKAIIELHGGTIQAFSDGRGRGARFCVEVATVDAPAPPADATPAAPLPADAASLRILLVEDHLDTQKVLSRLLEMLGHEVETAASVAQAVGRATARASAGAGYDLLISDLGLPDGSGLDLLPRLKSVLAAPAPVPEATPNAATHVAPVAVALSGFGMEDDLRKSREAGYDHHLIKPVEFEALEVLIQQIAAARRGRKDGGMKG